MRKNPCHRVKSFLRFLFPALLALALLPGAGGCEKPPAPGEIALVNGAPISLKQLQAAHDAVSLNGDISEIATPALRGEYGALLADLVVQELVLQELSRLHLSVTEEELAAEEALFRSDFPGEEFERMLLEESIDLDIWRDSLHRHLAMKKFLGTVLREAITLGAQEVEAYYLERQDSFRVPEFIHFIQVNGLVREQISAACEQFRQTPDAALLQANFPNFTVREVHMQKDRLSPEQLAGLDRLDILQSSPVQEMNGEFFGMVLLNREEPRAMTRTETYALIEGLLLEKKIRAEFEKWLEARLKESDISISMHLIPENLRK
ncbi:MAG: peptidyl-prolyl cis-trans isomerase [Deltaproteobacteria bacterium]|jgi:hypothetical protein|nr:peptidyl-prolyl cis-trans isomerase [Deltaproteobacteria bacterium]